MATAELLSVNYAADVRSFLMRRFDYPIAPVVVGLILGPVAEAQLRRVLELNYKDPERLVSLWEKVPTHGRWRASPGNFHDWKKQNTLFEDMSNSPLSCHFTPARARSATPSSA